MKLNGVASQIVQPTWTGDPPPDVWRYGTPTAPHTTPLPNIYEQMGVDPISKLAAAIERLAAALEGAKQ